jgi:peptidoglycan/xylan/chitin deacetylase (PgdA/CDA1 family)
VHSDPQVGCERRRLPTLERRGLDLDGDGRLDLAGVEDERTPDEIVGFGARGGRAQGEQQQRYNSSQAVTITRAIVALVALAAIVLAAGCQTPVEAMDGAFYDWDDRVVHCSVEGDASTGNTIEELERGLDRAKERGEVFEVLIHRPGDTMTWADFERFLRGVNERGLAWVTYEDMANGIPPVAGVSLQYDGTWIVPWLESRLLLQNYGARVTIFVTRYTRLTDGERAQIRMLADDGHDIEAHAVNHLRGPVYVEDHGLGAYIDLEVQPSIDALRADGYDVVSFAYPFGDRTSEIDRAVGTRVPLTRSIVITRGVVSSPCPI